MRRTNWKTLWLCFLFAVLFFVGTSPPVSADTIGPSIDSYSPANGAKLPAGWITVNVRVLDPDKIQGGSQQLLINGQAVPAVLNYDVLSIDPVTETVIYDYTHAVITYRKLYSDGMNNVQLTVKDQLGNVTTLNWAFEVATAPTISNLTPAPSTATAETMPVISAKITHSGGVAIDPAGVTMNLNGLQVPAAFDSATGLLSFQPAPLTIGETHTVSVTAKDANGRSSTADWHFTVVYPDMPVPNAKADCLGCHASQPQSHKMSNCAACHDVALRNIYANQSPPPHFVAYSCSACHYTKSHEDGAIAGQPAWYPIDAKYNCNQCHQHNPDNVTAAHKTTTTGCQDCHSTVLTREHYRDGRVDELGSPINCFTCHTSSRPEVKQAITNKDTSCTACHAGAGNHADSHTNPTFTALAKDPDMDCAVCHNSDIAGEHTNRKDSAGVNYTCDTCHKNTRPEVQTAIAGKNKNCEACHIDPVTQQPTVHTSAGSPLHDSAYVLSPELACSDCHANNLNTVHVGQPNETGTALMDCSTCHNSMDPAVQAAVIAKSTNCDACHTTRHTNVNHTFPAGYVLSNPNNLNCADCHQGGSLTDLHVDKVTKAGATMTCNTCHGSAAPAAVKTAVANSQANCDACHSSGIHTDVDLPHTTSMPTTIVNCNDCHSPAVNLEHAARKDAAGAPYDCSTCHNSARTDIRAAITAGDPSCANCHTSIHPDAQYIPAHETRFKTQPDVSCSSCHNNNLINLHGSYTVGCSTCHNSTKTEVRTAIKNLDTDCSSCHINPVRHTAANLETKHTSSYVLNPQLDCQQCHSNQLSTEHVGKQSKLNPVQTITCDSCHTSTDTAVRNAIANHQTSCDACHTVHPDTAAAHTNPAFTALAKDPDMDCAQCHNSVISDEHTATKDAAGANYTCGTCHNSARSEVKAAISNKNKNCEACHTDPVTGQPKVHTSSGSPLHDSAYMLNPEVSCKQCHADNLKNEHVGQINTVTNLAMECATCHNNSSPAVQGAITAKDTNCTACHAYPPAKHQPVHTANVFTKDNTRPDAGTCVTCHKTTNLKDLHVSKVNSMTNQAMTCDTCHTSQDAKVVNAIVSKSTNSCESCHTVHAPKDATAVHDTVDAFAAQTDTDCTSCHNRNVKSEHIDKGRVVNGTVMSCDSCHSSSKPEVANAVNTDNTRCDACHTMPPAKHNPAHTAAVFTSDTTRTDLATCSLCHVKALPDQHVNKVTSAGTVMVCNTCHSGMAPANVTAAVADKNDNCEACHTVHPVKAAVAEHDSTSAFALNADVSCSGCHDRNIRTEHLDNPARTTSAGYSINCDTCHGSGNVSVQSAITAKDNSCTACHAYPTVKHQPKHLTTVYTTDTTRTDDCSLCHVTAIKDEHVGRVHSATGQAMTCDTCHTSADPKVVNAIVNKSTNSCEACHTTHPVKDVTQIHDSINFTAKTYTDPNMSCSSCHNSSLSTEHVKKTTEAGVTMNCDTCHKSTRPDVQNAIAANNLSCEACHTKVHTSPDPYHATTFVSNKTIACEKCHNASSIANDHSKFKTSTGAAISCGTCHKSTNTAVIDAIRTSSTGCDTCHTSRHTDVQTPHKTTYIPDAAWNCSNCHTSANTGYNMTASYHKIPGVTPTANLLHGGTFVSPWTATSDMSCRDCHNKNTSTNTYYGKLLKGAYTSTTGKEGYSTANQLCFFCHSTTAYGPGSSRTAKSGFNGDGGKNWHSIGNHIEKGGCMSCHSSKMHSGSNQHFIAIKSTAEPNSLITKFTHGTSYSKSSCTTSCH